MENVLFMCPGSISDAGAVVERSACSALQKLRDDASSWWAPI